MSDKNTKVSALLPSLLDSSIHYFVVVGKLLALVQICVKYRPHYAGEI